MKISCSNCFTTIEFDMEAGTVSHTSKAQGRGSKRVEAKTTTNEVFSDGYLFMWDAPCCTVNGETYGDSYEMEAVS